MVHYGRKVKAVAYSLDISIGTGITDKLSEIIYPI